MDQKSDARRCATKAGRIQKIGSEWWLRKRGSSGLGHALGHRLLELGILRMLPHFAAIPRVPVEFEVGAPQISSILRGCNGRQVILPVGQREAITEGAIRAQLDDPPANGHFRSRFSGS